MTTPLTDWDATSVPDNVVWASTLDDRYLVEVQPNGDGTGHLVVFDHDNDNKVIHEETVPLSFGARFGPDIGDIIDWQAKVEAIVDGAA